MVAPLLAWSWPAVVVAITAAFVLNMNFSPATGHGVVVGSSLAAFLAYVSTVSLRWAWNRPSFWAVWAAGILARFVFVAATAYVVFRHTKLDFVTTMASLVGFTAVFLAVESATGLKKG